ncbi:triphosphoribosyl-dephospho-CoA synthase [Methylomonas sp. AM2-LC]|uniref:triphosphoribosyl-dephospho-CoA synthase n=1 Tax=Methylomonas sp. AM2-LC TaxID=3153301 RepID=UPI003266EF1A
MLSPEQLTTAYLQACETELQAFKPGNVSIYSAAHDMTVDDFRVSAAVSAPALTNPAWCLGEKIYYAVKATREAVACNTNLGIILLCAPLLQAAMQQKTSQDLRTALADVLANTTRMDADWTFKAISLAAPGGLGSTEQHDVHQPAEITLLEAMILSSPHDRIALQYTNCFKDIFEFAIFEYNRAFVLSGNCGWSALTIFCEMLARYPDSHIERKYGKLYSAWIKSEMVELCKALKNSVQHEELMPRLFALDKAFKAKKINPGTTADITVAAVLVIFLQELGGNFKTH